MSNGFKLSEILGDNGKDGKRQPNNKHGRIHCLSELLGRQGHQKVPAVPSEPCLDKHLVGECFVQPPQLGRNSGNRTSLKLTPDTIYEGHALEILKSFPAESIDCVVTSPPYYGLRCYGTDPVIWSADDDCDHEWKQETTTGQKTAPTMYKAAEDAFKPTESAFCSKCSAWRGELGGEPTPELFISHLCDVFDQVKRVLKTFGTCWINIADSYSNKDLVGIPEMFALEMKSRGWIRRNTIIWHKPNAMPRSVRDRFTEDFEYIFFFTKSKNYYFEQQIEPYSQSYQKEQRAPGYVRQHEYENSKYNKHHFNPTMPKFGGKKHLGYGNPIYSGKEWKPGKGRNKRSVWRIPVGNFKGDHFTTFPKALVETPLKAGCPKGGIVLDIFSGAGTTCMVAAQNDRRFIGIELNPKFREMALERINKVRKTFDSGQASDALEPPADKTIKMAA